MSSEITIPQNTTLSLDEHSILFKLLENLYKSKNYFNDFSYGTNIKLDYLNSSINRYIKIIDIYNEINLNKVKTIFTVFKLQRNSDTINYAYLYGSLIDNRIFNKFIITSNTLVSKDGMYAHRLIHFDHIKKESEVISIIYEYLKSNVKLKEYNLKFEVFNIDETLSNYKEVKDAYVKKLSDTNLLLKTYAISWLIELYNMYRNNQEVNMNIHYNNIMFTEKDKIKFASLYKIYKREIYELVIFYKFYTHDTVNRLEIGQKIIPFNYIQLKEYNNIIHFQWKEILINKIVTNLLYNINAPTFSLFIDWMLINNSNKYLYDNKEIYNKILYSDKIKSILQLLNKANKEFTNIHSAHKNEFINSLIKKLKKIIKLSEQKVLMSNVSLCYLSEYSGKTVYDYFNKIKDPEQVHRAIGNLYMDLELVKKYMFEIIYGLYNLNLKGIIHGDLHLNNVTFNKKNLNVSDNSYVIYSLNLLKNNDIVEFINYSNSIDKNAEFDENDNITYIFKHTGTYPCIIDFSRSFVLLKLISENIIEKDKNDVRNKFIKNEQNRIMSTLQKIFPNFIKNSSHKLKFLFKNKNFNILFLYFSAFDIFKFSSNLLMFINKYTGTHKIPVNPEIINFLDGIVKKSYSYLEKVIDETAYTNITDLKFPNLELILEFFPEYKHTSIMSIKNIIKSNKIVDLFTINNIENYLSIDEINEEIRKHITTTNLNEIALNNKDMNYLDIILKKINNFINFSKSNEDLEIEQLINKEYYNIKNNVSFLTSENHTFGSITTSDMSIENF